MTARRSATSKILLSWWFILFVSAVVVLIGLGSTYLDVHSIFGHRRVPTEAQFPQFSLCDAFGGAVWHVKIICLFGIPLLFVVRALFCGSCEGTYLWPQLVFNVLCMVCAGFTCGVWLGMVTNATCKEYGYVANACKFCFDANFSGTECETFNDQGYGSYANLCDLWQNQSYAGELYKITPVG